MEIIGIILVVLVIAYFVSNNKKDKKVEVSVKPVSKPEKPSVAELKKLTKNQLIELAEKKNLKVKKSGAKAAVISEIRDQLK
jgi:hypothetical protein